MPSTTSMLTAGACDHALYFSNLFFAPSFQWWEDGAFAPRKAPLAELANTLSGDNKRGEMVYLNRHLNILKAKVCCTLKIPKLLLMNLDLRNQRLSDMVQIREKSAASC